MSLLTLYRNLSQPSPTDFNFCWMFFLYSRSFSNPKILNQRDFAHPYPPGVPGTVWAIFDGHNYEHGGGGGY